MDTSSTETKGTVLIKNAEELESYSASEEAKLESYIKVNAHSLLLPGESFDQGIIATGAKVVVSGSSIGEMAMHFLDKHGIMVLKITSKFELRRLCRATGATALSAFRYVSSLHLPFKQFCTQSSNGR